MSKFSMALAAAAALTFASVPVTSALADDASTAAAQVSCYGANACKGQSACKTKDNACKGQNACKGKGMVSAASADDCKAKGGSTEEAK